MANGKSDILHGNLYNALKRRKDLGKPDFMHVKGDKELKRRKDLKCEKQPQRQAAVGSFFLTSRLDGHNSDLVHGVEYAEPKGKGNSNGKQVTMT